MGYSRSTQNLKLPQFQGSDKPKWTEDINDAFAKLDDAILNKIYPVGSIYMSVNNVSPQTFLGGTWEPYAQGRFIAGIGSTTDAAGNSINMSAGEVGGQKTHSHTLPANTGSHALTVSQMPSHSHTLNTSKGGNADNSASDKVTSAGSQAAWNNNAHAERAVMNEGGNQGHSHTIGGNTGSVNVWNPYCTAYIWKRTA